MSLFDYQASRQIAALDPPFAALVMAAYRKADTGNALKLSRAFPDICTELQQRYEAPGGLLPRERQPVTPTQQEPGEVVDLLGALQDSVARAKADRQSRADS